MIAKLAANDRQRNKQQHQHGGALLLEEHHNEEALYVPPSVQLEQEESYSHHNMTDVYSNNVNNNVNKNNNVNSTAGTSSNLGDNDMFTTASQFTNPSQVEERDESQALLTPLEEQTESMNEAAAILVDAARAENADRAAAAAAAASSTATATATTKDTTDTATATATASASTSDTTNNSNNNNNTDAIRTLCHTTHTELTNLGKALTCPICQSTYTDAVMLPCVHAYCRGCIVTALRTHKPECPTCKQPCKKRSLVECHILQEMAVAYKQVTRALGWSPSVYSDQVEMTQLPNTSLTKTPNTPTKLVDCHEQLQAAKTWQRAMDSSLTTNDALKEERRKVVQVNQTAIVQAAVKKRRQSRERAEQGAVSLVAMQGGEKGDTNVDSTEKDEATTAKAASSLATPKKQCKASSPKSVSFHGGKSGATTDDNQKSGSKISDAADLVRKLDDDDEVVRKEAKSVHTSASTADDDFDHSIFKVTKMNNTPAPTVEEKLNAMLKDDDYDNDDIRAPKQTADKHKKATPEDDFFDDDTVGLKQTLKRKDVPSVIDAPSEIAGEDDQDDFPYPDDDDKEDSDKEESDDSDIEMSAESMLVSAITPPGMRRAPRRSTKSSSTGTVTTTSVTTPPVVQRRRPFRSRTAPSTDGKRRSSRGSSAADDATTPISQKRNSKGSTAPKRSADSLDEITTGTPSTVTTSDAATTAAPDSRASRGSTAARRSATTDTSSMKTIATPVSKKRASRRTTAAKEAMVNTTNEATVTPEGQASRGSTRRSAAAAAVTGASTVSNEDNTAIPVTKSRKSRGSAAARRSDAAAATTKSAETVSAITDATTIAATSNSATTGFTVGTVVRIQSRTWPGINKPGGVARITKVHADSLAYDVAYVLGGREKGVGAAYVSSMDDKPVDDDASASSPNPHRSSRRTNKGDEIPVSVLQALEMDGFLVDRKKRKAPSTAATVLDEKENKKKKKKEGAATKTQKAAARTATKKTSTKRASPAEDSEISDVEPVAKKPARKKARKATKEIPVEPIVVLPELSEEEMFKLADARYSNFWMESLADEEGIVNVVASSISDTEKSKLTQLAKDAKKQNIKIKVSEVFNPKKTTLAITSSDTATNIDGVAKSRTLKVMRASLAGIPIVTPHWIEKCCSEKNIVAPTSEMFIRSLPTKSGDIASEISLTLYGTALVAARLQQVETEAIPKNSAVLPLKNVNVHLCGTFTRPPKSDLQLLLRESGATVQSTMAAALKLLQSAAFIRSGKKAIFMCDEATSNELCGISVAQASQIQLAMEELSPGRILVVNSQWLFDVVTCGTPVPSDIYEPASQRCKDLWSAACN